jgi:hypothetical protein
MSSLLNVSINVADLPKEKFVKGKKGVYYNFTISVNDETNQFGQNVGLYDSQTKEERENGKSKHWIGNGRVVWNDGNITNAVSQNDQPKNEVVEPANDDLPF